VAESPERRTSPSADWCWYRSCENTFRQKAKKATAPKNQQFPLKMSDVASETFIIMEKCTTKCS
jgi:hypothetical protein